MPPILLDTAVARESCGDAAVYVPVSDLPATTRGLESLPSTNARDNACSPRRGGAGEVLPRAARETLAVLEAAGSGPAEGDYRPFWLKPDTTLWASGPAGRTLLSASVR